MRRAGGAALLVAALCAPSTAWGLEQLICIGTKAIGLSWDKNAWVGANFKVDSDRFWVSEVAPYEHLGKQVHYQVKKFGTDKVHHVCEKFGSMLYCGGLGYGMLVNLQKLRYQEFYGSGYIEGLDSNTDTPSITIGTCTRAG